jgi:hypothetical protein
VLFWFFAVGGLTVVMAGGISPRTGPAAPIADDAGAGENAAGESCVESGPESPLDEAPVDADEPEREVGADEPEPVPQPEVGADADDKPEPEPEPGPPPPPVKPAPYLEDVEDLMFVDADIEADRRKPPR